MKKILLTIILLSFPLTTHAAFSVPLIATFLNSNLVYPTWGGTIQFPAIGAPYFIASSTTATSTFSGNISSTGTNTQFNISTGLLTPTSQDLDIITPGGVSGSGAINVTTGNTVGGSGPINITTGNVSSGGAGAINLTGGNGGLGGGNIILQAGKGSSSNGVIELNPNGLNVGIGTTSPYSMLSVAGQIVGLNFVATSTNTASIFPYASTTALTVAGTNGLTLSAITGLTQCLHVNTNGLVSGTGSDCGSGGGSGTVNSGLATQVAYYASNGTAVSGTSSVTIKTNSCVTGATGNGLTIQQIVGSNANTNYQNTTPCTTNQLGIDETSNNMVMFGSANGSSWNRPWVFPFSITQNGYSPTDVQNGAQGTDQQNSFIFFQTGGLTFASTSSGVSDTGLHVGSYSASIHNSGSSYCLDTLKFNGSSTAEVGNHNSDCLIAVGPWAGWIQSAGATTLNMNSAPNVLTDFVMADTNTGPIKGLDHGNYPYWDADMIDGLFRIPMLKRDVVLPNEHIYAFTVSGVTTPPTVGGLVLYTILGQQGGLRYQVGSFPNTLSGGAGTILMVGTSTPPSSGVLVKAPQSDPGDQLITYSNVAVVPSDDWVDAFKVNIINGQTTIGTTTFSGITGSTQCLHVDTSGNLSGTGSDCGSGGGSTPVGNNTIQYDNNGSLGSVSNFFNISGNMQMGTSGILYASGPTGVVPDAFASTTLRGYFFGNSGKSSTINTTQTGSDDTGLGDSACSSLTSGFEDTCIGSAAGKNLTSGFNNILIGGAALEQATSTVSNSTIIGVGAGFNIGTGSNPAQLTKATIIGTNAVGSGVASGDQYTTYGYQSCYNLGAAQYDTCIGANAGFQDTTGQWNTYLGDNAGANFNISASAGVTTGSQNEYIGYASGPTLGSLSNSGCLGYFCTVNSSNSFVLGSTNFYGGTQQNIGIGSTSPWGRLSVGQYDPTIPFFVIGSSTAATSATSTIFIVSSKGNVGIASSSPTYALSVEGQSSPGNQATAGFFTATSTTSFSTFNGGVMSNSIEPIGSNDLFVGQTNNDTSGITFSNASENVTVNSIAGLFAIATAATSTSNVGFNISSGCYAINNVCTGGGTGTNFFTQAGVKINQNTGSIVSVGSIQATSTTATSTFAADVTVGTSTNPNTFVVDYTGNVGIGTSTPFSLTSISKASTSTIPYLSIASTTNALSQFVFNLDQSNHMIRGGVKPTLSSCGTNPAISGTDDNGTVFTGSGIPSSCVITFASPYGSNVNINPMITIDSTSVTGGITATSSTGFTVTFTGNYASGGFSYITNATYKN